MMLNSIHKKNYEIVMQSPITRMSGVEITNYDLRISLHMYETLKELLIKLSEVQKLIDIGVVRPVFDMYHNIGYYDSIEDCLMEFTIVTTNK